MPGQDVATAGQNVQVELVLDGVPAEVVSDVLSFTANAQYQTIESRPIGSTTVRVQKIPDGWAGDLEVERRSGSLDRLVDAYNAAVRDRVPVLINLSQTVFYMDGSSSRYTYPDVVLDFSTSARRGDTVTSRIGWRTGKERI